jgi:hypothetical protein
MKIIGINYRKKLSLSLEKKKKPALVKGWPYIIKISYPNRGRPSDPCATVRGEYPLAIRF